MCAHILLPTGVDVDTLLSRRDSGKQQLDNVHLALFDCSVDGQIS
jgi:hypothetical protein